MIINVFLYSIGISVFYDEIDKTNASRISKKLLKCCERWCEI